jgi:hypothetical protein
VTPGSGTYRTDYLGADASGIYEHGTGSISIPAADSNGNGMPDVLEPPLSGNFAFSGSSQCHASLAACASSTLSGNVLRSAGVFGGTYSGVYNNPAVGFPISLSGSFALAGAVGGGQYDFGGNSLDLAVTSVQEGYNYEGVATFMRVGTSQIMLAATTLTDASNGLSVSLLPATLNRVGNKYQGVVTAVDGDPDTTWADYTQLLLEIVDNNDSNGDGIPDLSNVDPCAGLGGDPDGDGFCSDEDSCPSIADPDQFDTDEDGWGDACDNCTDVMNSDQADADAGGDDDSSLAGMQHYGDVCDADLNNDGTVNTGDFFGFFRPCFGASVTSSPECASSDFDGSGTVNTGDFFGFFRPQFGGTPGPGTTEP